MNYELDADQRAIVDAAGALLERHAGAGRAVEMAAKGDYDHALERALDEAGFTAVASEGSTGPLEAALLTEAVARAGGVTAFGAAALVAPALAGRSLPAPIALARAGESGPVRYAAHAHTLLVADGDAARVVALEPGDAEPVPSSFGYPLGRIAPAKLRGGESLGAGTGPRLLDLWRVALAAECAGAMDAALEVTVEYLKGRRQFGRAIASFQAVQHRLALCRVQVEGSRWLAREAAWLGCPPAAAAAAAAYAGGAAARVFAETHQLSGAIGYTREHPLHAWSMRLPVLRLELEGVAGHRRALARSLWGS